ncbi:orotidine-5'-phosphate decarboxylase [Fontimonas thermophila]|uniref:Orotidine 5'-phosphate decarboxylase n=1 Tax=Fontimonas thermophila TaxID=1076937 RepID=A0A1I2HAU4_9GAMM|nr:orotidine-5'-phosphate decarboxylase [Fontimonas thermophila]SFF25721.1 orotidine-5'-phosphate decarboxylase [Fontimonas thermophila]
MDTIAAEDRLIVALDVPSAVQARALVIQLQETVRFYKIGLELLMAPGFFDLLDWLKGEHKKVFVDLKFFDIPETVARAVRNLAERGADFCTVHGNQSIMEAAAKAKSGGLKVLAVTALTSLDRGDLADLGFACDVADLVLSRARRALAAGCDGVVSSGLEVARLRAEAPRKLICVTPGIRPVDNRIEADQKRIMTPAAAIRAGADYLVVGRPIRDAADPRAMAMRIQSEILHALHDAGIPTTGAR